MDFFIGAITTLTCLYVFNKMKITNLKDKLSSNVKFPITQSRMLNSAEKIFFKPFEKEAPRTQSKELLENSYVKVAITEDKVYWIENNNLMFADILDGGFEKENGKRVDTMGMDNVELMKISYIVDQLTNGESDGHSNTRKSQF